MNIQDIKVNHYSFNALIDSEDLTLLEQLALNSDATELLEISGDFTVSLSGTIPKITIHNAGIYNGLNCVELPKHLINYLEEYISTHFDNGQWDIDYMEHTYYV